MTWALAACLVAGAVAAVWPAGGARLRVVAQRRLGGAAQRPPDGAGRRLDGAALRRVGAALAQRPRRALAGSVISLAGLALVLGGPVAGVVGAVYAGLAGRALIRRAARRREAAARAAALDDLAALAADLRAGLVAAALTAPAGGRIAELTSSAWRLAERTGAPAADLIERIEADARAADRAAASAAAQAAGAQATALLLAGLPLGGIALGVAIGADPVRVLLHTPIGAACAIVAVLLQGGGLLWAERLARGAAR